MNFDVDARTILLVRHGSHAYGLNTPASDEDNTGAPEWHSTPQTTIPIEQWWFKRPRPYIPCDPYVPFEPIYPNPWLPDVWPWHPNGTTWPTTITTTSAAPVFSQWRVKALADGVELSIDVPGVKLSDMKLEVVEGILKLTTKRSDTGLTSDYQYSLGGSVYDLGLTTASLLDGVLTIKLISVYAKKSHVIVVTSKK